MNATTISTLVRHLRRLTKQDQPDPEGARLAQEFAAICQTLNQRLGQCEIMLNQGNDSQALQLAEAPPAVMQVLADVGFKELARWRSLCERQQWPAPAVPDAAVIRRLNELYARCGSGENRQHKQELVTAARAALMQHDDEAALHPYRLAAQMDPNDAEVRSNLDIVQDRILRDRLSDLEDSLAKDSPDDTLFKLAEIEALVLPRPVKSDQQEIWLRAQLLRVQQKLCPLQALRDAEDWAGVLELVQQVNDLCAEHGVVLAGEDAVTLARHETWARNQKEAFEQEQLYIRSLNELEFLIEQSEKKQFTLREVSLRTLRVDADAIHRKWGEVTRFDRAVPIEVQERYDKTCLVLKAEIETKSRQRRNQFMVAGGSLVVLVLVVGILLMRHRSANNAAAYLRAAVQNRLPITASNRVEEVVRDSKGLTNASPLKEALAEARQYSAQEFRRAAECRETVTVVGRQVTGLPKNAPVADLQQLQRRMDEADQAILSLPGEVQPPPRDAFRKVSTEWDAILTRARDARRTVFRQTLDGPLKQAEAELDYARGSDAVAATLGKLRSAVNELHAQTNPPLPALALPPELLLDFTGLAGRCDGFSRAVDHWRQTTNRLALAIDLQAYLETLRSSLTNGFASSAHRDAAEVTLRMDLSTNRLYSSIVFSGDSDAWSAFLKSRELKLRPAQLSPEELQTLKSLESDSYIHKVHRYLYRHSFDIRRMIYVDVAKGDALTWIADKKIFAATVYDPERFPLQTHFEERTFEKWQLPVEESNGPIPETAIYKSAGVSTLADGFASTNSVAEVLDRVRVMTNGAVFRAFLCLRLEKMLDLRPTEWGAQWLPALSLHRERLRQIVEGRLESGDWLLPGKFAKYNQPLDEFFRQTAAVSYVQQSRFFHRLAVEAAGTGWTYCGHVGLDGKEPRLVGSARSRDLYGWDQEYRMPALLFRWSEIGGRHERVRDPLPFSPLYALGDTPAGILEKTEFAAFVKANHPSVKPWLPKFFTQP